MFSSWGLVSEHLADRAAVLVGVPHPDDLEMECPGIAVIEVRSAVAIR